MSQRENEKPEPSIQNYVQVDQNESVLHEKKDENPISNDQRKDESDSPQKKSEKEEKMISMAIRKRDHRRKWTQSFIDKEKTQKNLEENEIYYVEVTKYRFYESGVKPYFLKTSILGRYFNMMFMIKYCMFELLLVST